MNPQLRIGYDSGSLPSDAACSARGETFPGGDNVEISREQRLIWYMFLFNLHLLEKHSNGSRVVNAKV